jgi:hypothetical protein
MEGHAAGLLGHLRSLYGSDEISDLVVVLTAQPQEASTSAAAEANGGPSKKRDRGGRAKAVPTQQEAQEAAGTRISAHSVVVFQSPVWRAELLNAGFKPAATEATGRKVHMWMRGRTRQGVGASPPMHDGLLCALC